MKQVENREKITQSPERHRNGIWHGSVTRWWRSLRVLRFDNRQRRQPSVKSSPKWDFPSAMSREMCFRRDTDLEISPSANLRNLPKSSRGPPFWVCGTRAKEAEISYSTPWETRTHTRANLIINETFSHTFRRIIFGKPKKNGLVSWWSTCYLSARAATTAVWLIGRRNELFFWPCLTRCATADHHHVDFREEWNIRLYVDLVGLLQCG